MPGGDPATRSETVASQGNMCAARQFPNAGRRCNRLLEDNQCKSHRSRIPQQLPLTTHVGSSLVINGHRPSHLPAFIRVIEHGRSQLPGVPAREAPPPPNSLVNPRSWLPSRLPRQHQHKRACGAGSSTPCDASQRPAIQGAQIAAAAWMAVPIPKVLKRSLARLVKSRDFRQLMRLVWPEPVPFVNCIRPRSEGVSDYRLLRPISPVSQQHTASFTRIDSFAFGDQLGQHRFGNPRRFGLYYWFWHNGHRGCL